MAGLRFNKLFKENEADQIEMIKPIKLLDTVWNDIHYQIDTPGGSYDEYNKY